MAILEEEDGLIATYTLTALAYDYEPDESGYIGLSDAHLVSVRRALSGLVRIGKLHDLGRRFVKGRKRWGNERVALRHLIKTMRMKNLMSGGHADQRVPKAMIERALEMGVDLT